jgi:diadenosine tetraphosphate (Ap4A) HIT family hydrolase
MSVDPNCIFCRIVAGDAEASIIFQDEFITVFMDIRPVIQGHSLVVPNVHYSYMGSIDQIHARKMFLAGQRIGDAIRSSDLRCEGINLFMADGSAAGQTVFHSHLHVIPRYGGDGFSLRFPVGYGEQPARNELDRIAANIAASMKI